VDADDAAETSRHHQEQGGSPAHFRPEAAGSMGSAPGAAQTGHIPPCRQKGLENIGEKGVSPILGSSVGFGRVEKRHTCSQRAIGGARIPSHRREQSDLSRWLGAPAEQSDNGKTGLRSTSFFDQSRVTDPPR